MPMPPDVAARLRLGGCTPAAIKWVQALSFLKEQDETTWRKWMDSMDLERFDGLPDWARVANITAKRDGYK